MCDGALGYATAMNDRSEPWSTTRSGRHDNRRPAKRPGTYPQVSTPRRGTSPSERRARKVREMLKSAGSRAALGCRGGLFISLLPSKPLTTGRRLRTRPKPPATVREPERMAVDRPARSAYRPTIPGRHHRTELSLPKARGTEVSLSRDHGPSPGHHLIYRSHAPDGDHLKLTPHDGPEHHLSRRTHAARGHHLSNSPQVQPPVT